MPSLLVVRMSNVAISDEMAPALTLYRFGIISPVISVYNPGSRDLIPEA